MSTTAQTEHPKDGREETQPERLDRNLSELTGELRVVVTGVQVLFAFLLVIPFDSGFTHVSAFERDAYLVTLLLSAAAAACMIGPAAAHRMLFRTGDKAQLVRFSNAMTIAGLGFLALAMSGSLLLVASKLVNVLAGALMGGAVALLLGLLWFGMPLVRRRSRRR